MTRPHIVIAGAGYVGLYAARRLQRKLKSGEASVTVIDPRPYFTYQPLLSDAAAGTVEPRHVVTAHRPLLAKCRVLTGSVVNVDSTARTAEVAVAGGKTDKLHYDILVVAPGSVTKTLPVPGLAEQAIGFTTLGEAIYLRNHVLGQLDKASSTDDHGLRQRLLTFTFVGGGYAGVEALGQLEEMARSAIGRYHDNLEVVDMRWVLVEAADRIMPEVSRSLADYAVDVLRERGIEVFLQTTTDTVEDGHVVLSDGTEFDTATIVWTTGVVPHPMLDGTDLPRDDKGRVQCRATLEVEESDAVFAAGDCAAVPDLTHDDTEETCAPTAQHAMRQAKQLADNITAKLRGEQMQRYRPSFAGSVAALGLHDGVAEIYGIKVKGWPAWAIHRLYHLSKMPASNRRVRLLVDWSLGLVFRREIVALGEIHEPRAEFAARARAS
jgi:NADH dehydrogenase